MILGGSLYPNWAFVMSEWNPSDRPSRLWENKARKASSYPRRTRTKKKVILRAAPPKEGTRLTQKRRNQKYNKGFDSPLGYRERVLGQRQLQPGELAAVV